MNIQKNPETLPSVAKLHLKGLPDSVLDPMIPDVNMLALAKHINAKAMSKVIIGRGEETLTNAELYSETEAVMSGLVSKGMKSGDKLMLSLPLIIEGVVLTLAANALGIKVIYANYEDTLEAYQEEQKRYEPDVLAVYEEYDGKESVILMTRKREDGWVASWSELTSQNKRSSLRTKLQAAINYKNDDELIYLQTSGSTAVRPKGLPFTNQNIAAALIYAANATGTTTHSEEAKKVLCILNFRHPYGWMPLFVNLLGGNRVELATGASPKEISKWHECRPSYIYGTPQFLRDFMRETPEDADLSFLRAFFCAGDSTSEELFEEFGEFCKKHNAPFAELRNNYGVGELLCIGTTSDGIEHRPGTSGKFYPGPDWVIVDENLNEVPYGVPGEIIVNSRTMIKGYFDNPEETEKSFIDFRGKIYFRTGDFASLSTDGYVTIVGRMKDFYIPRNATDKVNCDTIKKPLNELDLVESSSVVIYKLADRSDSSCAFVVLKDGVAKTKETKNTILVELKKRLRPFELPSKLVFVDEIPRVAAGKDNRVLLGEVANGNLPPLENSVTFILES